MLKYRKIFYWNGKLHLLSEPREQRNKQQGGSTMAKAREGERGWSQPELLSIRGFLCLSVHHHRKQQEPWDDKGGLHKGREETDCHWTLTRRPRVGPMGRGFSEQPRPSPAGSSSVSSPGLCYRITANIIIITIIFPLI